MKKLLLAICLILIGLISKSQDVYTIYRVDVTVWDGATQQYTTDETINNNPVGLYLTIKGTVVMISDQADSYYITDESTYRESVNNYVNQTKWWAWTARDEKNRLCYLQMTYNAESAIKTMNVMYMTEDKASYKAFIYYYK